MNWLKENWFKIILLVFITIYLVVQIKAHDLEVRKAVMQCANKNEMNNKICLEIYGRMKFSDFKHLFW